MALPTLDKPWNFDVNIALPTLGTADADGRRLVRAIKAKILAGGKWAVKRSSNASSVANSDLWSTDASVKCGAAGSAHSWIVFQRTDITFELLIDVAHNAVYDRGNVLISRAGFTGGTITNRPTATDENYVLGSATVLGIWHNAGTGTFSVVLHNFYSADGQVQRIVAVKANVTVMFVDLSTLKNPPTGLASPFVVGWIGQSPTFALLNDTSNGGRYFGMHGALGFSAFIATEGYTVSGTAYPVGQRQTVQNEMSSAWSMTLAAVVGYTPSVKGRHGALYDLWFGEVNKTNCTTYPADHSRQFIQFGHLILPWNSSTVLTS